MNELPTPSRVPCGTCPYRLDVPSGVWAASEYKKLPGYDGETFEQVMKGAIAPFYCHQNDGHLCAGWLGCHDASQLAALRMVPVDPACFDYISPVPLFASGAEAAEHGMKDNKHPGRRARVAISKLEAKREGQDA